MHGLQDFRNSVAEILTDYDNDMDMSYESASTRLEIEIDRFSVSNAVDMPDEAMDAMFSAFSEFHIKAFEHQHISEAEACRLIRMRAKDMFENSRGWEAVEAMTQPYIDRIESEASSSRHFGTSEGTTFQGPFGDISMN